jgi:GNAT superfamily N-acetyltransferase
VQLSLRLAEAKDLEFCAKISREHMAPYFTEQGIHWDPQRYIGSWDAFENWIILCDQAAVGSLRLKGAGTDLEIRELQVLPQHRGKGVGSWALQQAKVLARLGGYTHVALRVYISNPAQRLYVRHGFAELHRDQYKIHMRATDT